MKPIGHNTPLLGYARKLVFKVTAPITSFGLQLQHGFFKKGVDEQLIMEKTGHQSLEGVRSYKRTSSTQQQHLSDILNATSTRTTDLQSADKLSLVPSISVNPGSDYVENSDAVVCSISSQSSNSLAMHVTQPQAFLFSFMLCYHQQ